MNSVEEPQRGAGVIRRRPRPTFVFRRSNPRRTPSPSSFDHQDGSPNNVARPYETTSKSRTSQTAPQLKERASLEHLDPRLIGIPTNPGETQTIPPVLSNREGIHVDVVDVPTDRLTITSNNHNLPIPQPRSGRHRLHPLLFHFSEPIMKIVEHLAGHRGNHGRQRLRNPKSILFSNWQTDGLQKLARLGSHCLYLRQCLQFT